MAAPALENLPDGEPPPDPCYRCACCDSWAWSLALLRSHVARHTAGELRVAPCAPDCLVCAEIQWQSR